jgi:hypothetical protein
MLYIFCVAISTFDGRNIPAINQVQVDFSDMFQLSNRFNCAEDLIDTSIDLGTTFLAIAIHSRFPDETFFPHAYRSG